MALIVFLFQPPPPLSANTNHQSSTTDLSFPLTMCNHFNKITKLHTCSCQFESSYPCINWEVNWQHNEMCMLDHFQISRNIGGPCPHRTSPEQGTPRQTSPEHERAVLKALQIELRRQLE